jgi:hypothetical protein
LPALATAVRESQFRQCHSCRGALHLVGPAGLFNRSWARPRFGNISKEADPGHPAAGLAFAIGLYESRGPDSGCADGPSRVPFVSVSVCCAPYPAETCCTYASGLSAEVDRAGERGLFDLPAEAAVGRELTPLERAQEFAYDAMEAAGRLRIKRARQTLVVSPDCADAWVILAESASTPISRLSDMNKEWRPVSARSEPNGSKNFKVSCGAPRYTALHAIERNRGAEVGALLEEYGNDVQAMWPYARALWLFRTEGDKARTRGALAAARRVNPHVVRYLVNPDLLPFERPPQFALGSKDEAAYVAEELGADYSATADATSWLRTLARKPRKGAAGLYFQACSFARSLTHTRAERLHVQ